MSTRPASGNGDGMVVVVEALPEHDAAKRSRTARAMGRRIPRGYASEPPLPRPDLTYVPVRRIPVVTPEEGRRHMATDLTITTEDRPGGLASVGEALGAAGINIEGLLGIGMEGRGIIHVCVQDGAAARKALEGAGLRVEDEAEAILGGAVKGADQPGTLGMMARQIADAGVNIRAVYVATNNRAVMVTDDNAKVMEMMANM